MKNVTACIDFGTSNSTACIIDGNGNVKPIKLEEDSFLLPSAMFFYHNLYDKSDENNGKIFFGRHAESENMKHYENGRFLRSFKSLLGNTDLFSDNTMIYDRPVYFANILALFLSRMKLLIDIAAKQDVKTVVMGRPVHFVDDDSEKDKYAELALKEIAQFVGFTDVSFQYEPVAAAFYHKQKMKCQSNTIALIVDIGGGTSDFSIVDMYDNTVFANTGVHIGGNDFDESFASKCFMPLYGKGTSYYSGSLDVFGRRKKNTFPVETYDNLCKWTKVNDVHSLSGKKYDELMFEIKHSCAPEKVKYLKEIMDKKLGFKNLAKIEDTKKKLSVANSLTVDLDFLSDRPQTTIEKTDFEESIQSKVTKIMESISNCLNDSGKTEKDIDVIIFTGGSSQIPYIQQKLKKRFSRATVMVDDSTNSVSTGLAYYFKSQNK